MELTVSQKAALRYIEDFARTTKTVGQVELGNVLAMSNIAASDLEMAIAQIQAHARVCLQFHPDRIAKCGRSVVQALYEDGVYRNQFETHLSNGRLDPIAEGERARWEDRMFGGVFNKFGAQLSERPKYGALDLMRHADGPSPRFGSCYFVLARRVSDRCTFSYMDSHREPHERGTLETFKPIIAGLLTECFERRFALGVHPISPTELVNRLLHRLSVPYEDPSRQAPGRNLNHYIEAQVHGRVSLEHDIDIAVVDPSFKGTEVEEFFERLAEKYAVQLYWHGGFALANDAIPSDFRGPRMPSLGKRISENGRITAYLIGKAAKDLKLFPENWASRGSPDSTLQELKCLWHVLVQYGSPS